MGAAGGGCGATSLGEAVFPGAEPLRPRLKGGLGPAISRFVGRKSSGKWARCSQRICWLLLSLMAGLSPVKLCRRAAPQAPPTRIQPRDRHYFATGFDLGAMTAATRTGGRVPKGQGMSPEGVRGAALSFFLIY